MSPIPLASVAGLHHVTAITGAPQANHDFYVGLLGQRLVKKTVNFDDPGTYHLYYGDRTGTPGSILTFFPYTDARRGREGAGAALTYAYGVAESALDGWAERLTRAGLEVHNNVMRFGAPVLGLRDPHGQRLELIGRPDGPETPRRFAGVTLWVDDPAPTARVLRDIMGYREVGQERDDSDGAAGERLRLTDAEGTAIDILRRDGAPRAQGGIGSIHHIAFRAADHAHQAALREALLAAGHRVTEAIDRQYFTAIYFREPGGTLFEIATDPPGFATDETVEDLGTSLRLPPQHEPLRARIEAVLPKLDTRAEPPAQARARVA